MRRDMGRGSAPPRRRQRGAGAGGLAAAPQSARQSLRGRARRGAARRGSARVWQEGGRGCGGGRRAREGGRRRGSAPGVPRGTSAECARGTDFFARGQPSGPGCCAQASAHSRRARTAGETHLHHGVAWNDRGGARDRRPRGARAVAAARGAATRACHRRAETPSSAWPR